MPVRNRLLAAAVLSCTACTAQYDGPESVEYDPVGDRYFISNTGDGTIKQRDQAGTVTAFASVSPDPYGLEILGDTLYACSGGSVKGYLLADGSPVFNLSLGGSFLNGITTDGTYLYATDFSGLKIYRVDPAAGTFTTWVASTGGTPNGIVYDAANDVLLVAYWGSGAIVRGYDRTTAAITASVSTGVGSIDGIAIECHGRVVISSWSPNRISRFEWGIISPVFEDLMVPGLSQPADIDYDTVNHRICIPNAGNDQVILFDLADCATGVVEVPPYEDLRVIPNPTPGIARIDIALAAAVNYLLLDAKGLLIGGGTLPKSGLLDLGTLPRGIYTLDFPTIKKRARVVKE